MEKQQVYIYFHRPDNRLLLCIFPIIIDNVYRSNIQNPNKINHNRLQIIKCSQFVY